MLFAEIEVIVGTAGIITALCGAFLIVMHLPIAVLFSATANVMQEPDTEWLPVAGRKLIRLGLTYTVIVLPLLKLSGAI